MRPEVMGPVVRVPMFPVVEKRLVDEAVVENKLVVVADVVVDLTALKVVRVEEALETKPLFRTMVVLVAFSPVPRVVQGKAKDEPPPQPVQEPTVRLPMTDVLALRIVVVATLAMVTTLFPLIVSADTVDVANVVGLDVAR